MRSIPMRSTLTALAMGAAAILGAQSAVAGSEWSPCPGKGRGMMGGPPGSAQGMGPGMERRHMAAPQPMGQGPGPGMQGMGSDRPGMPRMGPGPGMGGPQVAGLSEEQSERMRELSDELQRKQWEFRGEMMDKRAALRDLYAEDRPDPEAVGAAYDELSELRRQMIESRIEIQNQMRDLLVEAQDRRMEQMREGAMPGPMGMGRPGMPPAAGYGGASGAEPGGQSESRGSAAEQSAPQSGQEGAAGDSAGAESYEVE